MAHHYADCVLCLSGRICEDSDAAPPKEEDNTKPGGSRADLFAAARIIGIAAAGLALGFLFS